MCAFAACVLGLNTLFVVCVRRGGVGDGAGVVVGGRQKGEHMDSFSSAVLCTDVLFLSCHPPPPTSSAVPFSPSSVSSRFSPPCSSTHHLPTLSRSVVLWQMAAAAAAAVATEQKPECEQGMGRGEGVVERRGGERRWGSGIWRAWLRGPLRGSVHVRVVG